MPHIQQHNNLMLQASKWGDTWEATANTPPDVPILRGYGDTPEEAMNNLKEQITHATD